MVKSRYLVLTGKRIVLFILCALIIVSAFHAAFGGIKPAQGSVSKKLPIYSVGRDENDKTISISFDAAWGNEDTSKLIEILSRYDIKATFFVVGAWVDKYPESVKELSDAGHEIMNHSDSHPHMSKLSESQISEEIENCNAKIEAITCKKPVLFRAPYGEYNDSLINVLARHNMHCIQWDVDSLDWKDLSASEITMRVCKKVRPGSIVLFHNAAKHTPEALPCIIDSLLAQGYKFVPISKNIYYKNYYINVEGKQIPEQVSPSN